MALSDRNNQSSPLDGSGYKGYQNIMEQQYQQGVITSAVLSFKNAHYHNQYLDSYVRYGVPGLLIVFVIFMSPYLLYGLQCTHRVFCVFQLVVCALLQD
jgi:O-antigen ligase